MHSKNIDKWQFMSGAKYMIGEDGQVSFASICYCESDCVCIPSFSPEELQEISEEAMTISKEYWKKFNK